MNEFKIDDMQFEILNFLLQNGEVRFTKLIENLSKSENFKHYGVESLKVILLRKIKPLLEKGYIQKKDLGHQNVHYLIPHEKLQTVKIMLEREALKKNFNEKLSSTNTLDDIEFYKKKLIELERERQKNKLLEQIRQFESLKVLPLKAVSKKLEKMGFKSEDFFLKNGSTRMINVGMDSHLNYFRPEDIEIKILRSRKPTPQELNQILQGMEKEMVLTVFEVPALLGPGWMSLTYDEVKGCHIIGAYKELLRLYQEYANLQLSEIKEAWQLSDEDFETLKPTLQEMMIREINNPLIIDKIVRYIINYFVKTKKDALEKVKRFYIKIGANEKDAEQYAREAIEEAQHSNAEN
jgi:DNA-binding Lrp family transcriptional regulator